jgi:hypothetical protein
MGFRLQHLRRPRHFRHNGVGGKEVEMRETNWTARIIAGAIVAIVVGVLVGGYVVSTREPAQQHMQEAVPNDRLPG